MTKTHVRGILVLAAAVVWLAGAFHPASAVLSYRTAVIDTEQWVHRESVRFEAVAQEAPDTAANSVRTTVSCASHVVYPIDFDYDDYWLTLTCSLRDLTTGSSYYVHQHTTGPTSAAGPTTVVLPKSHKYKLCMTVTDPWDSSSPVTVCKDLTDTPL